MSILHLAIIEKVKNFFNQEVNLEDITLREGNNTQSLQDTPLREGNNTPSLQDTHLQEGNELCIFHRLKLN